MFGGNLSEKCGVARTTDDQPGRNTAAQQQQGQGRVGDAGVGDAAAVAAWLQDGCCVRDAPRGTTQTAERVAEEREKDAGCCKEREDEGREDEEKDAEREALDPDDLESTPSGVRPSKKRCCEEERDDSTTSVRPGKGKAALASLESSPGPSALCAYAYTALMAEAKRREVTCVVKDAKGDAKRLALAHRLHALWDLSRPELDAATVRRCALPAAETLATLGRTRLAQLVAIRRELDASKAPTKKLVELLTDQSTGFRSQKRAHCASPRDASGDQESADLAEGRAHADAPPAKKRGRPHGSKKGGKIPATNGKRHTACPLY